MAHLALDGAEDRAVVADGISRLPIRAAVSHAPRLELRVPPRALVDEEGRVGGDDEGRGAAKAEEFAGVHGDARDGGVDGLEGLELDLRLDGFAERLRGGDRNLGVVDVRERAAETTGRAEQAETRVGVGLVAVAVDLLLDGLEADRLLALETAREGGEELVRGGGLQATEEVAVLGVQSVDGALQLADLLRLRAELVLRRGRGGDGSGEGRARGGGARRSERPGSSPRLGATARFQKKRRYQDRAGDAYAGALGKTPRTCSSVTVCCICASFSLFEVNMANAINRVAGKARCPPLWPIVAFASPTQHPQPRWATASKIAVARVECSSSSRCSTFPRSRNVCETPSIHHLRFSNM